MYAGRWTLTAPPAVEPVSVEEAKAHLRVDGQDHDLTVMHLITAARRHVEEVTRRALITQTWELRLDKWPRKIVLPRPKLIAVSTVKYLDTDYVLQTLAADQYVVVSQEDPAWIVPAYSVTWPTLYDAPNAVVVTYTAGYGATPGTVPADLRHAILLLVGQWFEHTEPSAMGLSVSPVPFTLDALIAPHRVFA